jgi:hypothetical protein
MASNQMDLITLDLSIPDSNEVVKGIAFSLFCWKMEILGSSVIRFAPMKLKCHNYVDMTSLLYEV